jgi:aryl-alcohol dehydrogenase-like predicted oxidoreductase
VRRIGFGAMRLRGPGVGPAERPRRGAGRAAPCGRARHRLRPVLAWLLSLGPHVLAIPGTSSVAHLEENVAAARIELDGDDLQTLEA